MSTPEAPASRSGTSLPAALPDAPLRVAFVPLIRPLFKGDSPRAARVSLEALERLGAERNFEVRVAGVHSDTVHAASGARVPPYAVTSAAEAERAARELTAEAPDLLLLQHTSFATGDLLAPLLASGLRLALWALPEAAGGRGPRGPLPLNALCGLNMTLSFLDPRADERHPELAAVGPVKWFYGEADAPWFRERFAPTLAALRGLRALAGARVLQIGGTAPHFYGLEEHPRALAGVQVETRELAELLERVAAVDEAAAAARAEEMRRGQRLESPEAQLQRAARIELGLAALAAEVDADALAVRCWPELPDACGAMACAAMGDLAGDGLPAACEGDVMGALSMLALQGVTRESAILMDLVDLDAERDALLLWHCGNAPLAWAAGRSPHESSPHESSLDESSPHEPSPDGHPSDGVPPPRLTGHFNRDGVGVVRDMALRPGPASGFRLLDGGRRAVILSGVLGDPCRAGFDGVRGWLGELRWHGERVDARQALGNVLDRRLPHHLALGRGEWSDALAELCGWLGAEPLPALPLRPFLRPPAGGAG